ncbi:hypothetical protein Vadar_008317 [Vaccinium darrowii]|uniref:Uncharacterized protein n=1 Tax=Vaccinium darrowii TaxID=229202 RepID=A0ACB7XGG7_9ERIC|nr:hypothetical protein Vadar_008317 [Vaccinium darrowii]
MGWPWEVREERRLCMREKWWERPSLRMREWKVEGEWRKLGWVEAARLKISRARSGSDWEEMSFRIWDGDPTGVSRGGGGFMVDDGCSEEDEEQLAGYPVLKWRNRAYSP